eukprot:CAMPEP_0168377920 /NCGR_PEP_ID=MMETSP0228-20121227/11071_1 /TAXON_ID=133427 /ORGANISM="Protoceratium reticulatum, Strain CCCM 535 (=CCMP 1889)" /LENGTH=728 /DNA_ID=CAMNT_0008390925 /DNA_START=29 /DNA_END=2212 /DNA_ORIENTATION=+
MLADTTHEGVTLEMASGVAILRVWQSDGSAGPCGTRLAACLRTLKTKLSKPTSKIHALLVWVTAEHCQEDPRTTQEEARTTFDLDTVDRTCHGFTADELWDASVLCVGMADRSTSCTETCLLAACHVVIATADVAFALMEPSAASVPLLLLRQLPAVAHHLADSAPTCPARCIATLDAHCAQRLGLVSEIVCDTASLRLRGEEFGALLRDSPAAAAAAALQRWPGQWIGARNLSCPSLRVPSEEPEFQSPWKRSRITKEPEAARDGCATQHGTVAAALLGTCPTQPEPEACTFIRDVLAGSLCTPKGKRHASQERVVGLTRGGLAVLEAEMQRAADATQATLEGAGAVRTLRQGHVTAAETRLAFLQEAVAQRQRQLSEDTAELREAAEALACASEAQAAGDFCLDGAMQQKAALEEALRDVYEPVRNGFLGKVRAKKNVAALVALGKQLDFDETVLVGVREVLMMRPLDRGAFDFVVLSAFESELADRVAWLDKALAEGVLARDECMAAARAAHKAARTAHSRSTASLEAACAAAAEGEAALATAQQAARALPALVAEAEAELEDAQHRLVAFRRGPLATLEELETFGTLAPSVAEAEGAAGPAEEARAEGARPPQPTHAPQQEEAQEQPQRAAFGETTGEEEAQQAQQAEQVVAGELLEDRQVPAVPKMEDTPLDKVAGTARGGCEQPGSHCGLDGPDRTASVAAAKGGDGGSLYTKIILRASTFF